MKQVLMIGLALCALAVGQVKGAWHTHGGYHGGSHHWHGHREAGHEFWLPWAEQDWNDGGHYQ